MTDLTIDLDKLRQAHLDAAAAITDIGAPDPEPEPIRPPVAFGDTVTVRQGQEVFVRVLANDQPGDVPIASVRIVAEPAHGGASVMENNDLRYAPDSAYAGFDSFDYIVVDEAGMSSQPAAVSITVTPTTPVPPVEPPPGPHKMRLVGMAPVASQSPDGSPYDSMAALMTKLEPGLMQGGRKFDLVSIFGLIDKRALLRPGRGYKADLYPKMTDRGQVALITMPILWRKEPKDMGGPGDFDSVLAGQLDDDYEAFATHLKASGQVNARIRLGHEGDLRGAFPWGANYDWHGLGNQANFQRQRGALKRVRDIFKRVMPGCFISSCHYWQPQVKIQGVTTYIDPSACLLDTKDCDGIGVDWYDGHGAAMTTDAIWNREANLTGPQGQPWGINKWAAYAKAKGKPLCIDEWGIMIRPDMTQAEKLQRDNPFFIKKMHEFHKAQGDDLAHMAYFHLGSSTSKLVPTTHAGTKRATDEFLRTFGKAG